MPSRAAQREAKPGAGAWTALDADLAALSLDQAAGYRQSQAGAISRFGASPRPLASERAFEHARQVFWCYALTRIGYLDPHHVLCGLGAQYDRAVGWRVSEGVAHQIVE